MLAVSSIVAALSYSPLLSRPACAGAVGSAACTTRVSMVNGLREAPAVFPACAVPRARQPIASGGVVVAEDYKLALSLVALGALIIFVPAVPGGFLALLGSFLIVQTLRIRFVFDDEAFEVKTKEPEQFFSADTELIKTGDNFAVGGDNRWAYDSFVNWDFFPSEALPILVYFKETQTPADKWDVGPGKWANSDEALAKGAKKGQVHFFPCIASAATLKDQFVARGCAKL
uniref:Uncharacterized protein n=1 Tax=Coccolithus braarudii TaxID=221442 RepID=A0A7S0LIW1_9EUKA|mmetsp:Transcript_38084/g.81119  ORF Transcript_38084/g.81119 Transcript_38084/m.81119 type:complete len:230 (+) Transcript_38084:22-711(+)